MSTLNKSEAEPLNGNGEQSQKNKRRSLVLYSLVAVLGVAVVALSAVLAVMSLRQPTSSEPTQSAASSASSYSLQFPLEDADLIKSEKPKDEQDQLRRFKYTHKIGEDVASGVMTEIKSDLHMYMDMTDELAFGEITNDDGQVTPYSLRVRIRNHTTGCDAFIVPFGISTRLIARDDSDSTKASMWPNFFYFTHICKDIPQFQTEVGSFVNEIGARWEFSASEAKAAWDHTVTPWLSHYCSVRRAESNNPGACMMPTSQVSKADRRALWTGRGVGERVGGFVGGKVGGYAGGAIGGAAGGTVGSVAGPVGEAVGGELGEHYGSQIGSHYGHEWGSEVGGDIGGMFDHS